MIMDALYKAGKTKFTVYRHIDSEIWTFLNFWENLKIHGRMWEVTIKCEFSLLGLAVTHQCCQIYTEECYKVPE